MRIRGTVRGTWIERERERERDRQTDRQTDRQRDTESTNVGRCCRIFGSYVNKTILPRVQVFKTFISPFLVCRHSTFLSVLKKSAVSSSLSWVTFCNLSEVTLFYHTENEGIDRNYLWHSLPKFSYKHLVDGFLQETSPLSCQKKWRQKERERKRYLWPFDAAVALLAVCRHHWLWETR